MYFSEFPKIYYDFPTKDGDRVIQVLTDITQNVRVRKNVLEKITLFEEYDIKDGDTPEIIAEKTYGNPEYHWVIMLLNQRYDYMNDFPMTSVELEEYIVKKYGNNHIDNVHHYEKNGSYAEAAATLQIAPSVVPLLRVNDYIEALPTAQGIVTAVDADLVNVQMLWGVFDAGMRTQLRDNLSHIVSFNIPEEITYIVSSATIKLAQEMAAKFSVGDTLSALPQATSRITSILPTENTINIAINYGRFLDDGTMNCVVRGIRRNPITLKNEFIKLPELGFTIMRNRFTLNDTYQVITNTDYENIINESKRSIRLLSPELADQFVTEFKSLV